MKLSELFDIAYGSSLELSNVEESTVNDGIPFVSRTEKNNGVSAYIVRQPVHIKLNPKHTLSVALGSSSVLETFYQPTEYYSGYHIGVLIPKIPMTREEMIFYALCIKRNKIKYSYGRQANRTLKDIEMPNINELPNWLSNSRNLNFNYKKNLNINLEVLKPFVISDIFDVIKGKSISIGDLRSEEGIIPIVSSSEKNNGITAYTKENALFKGNCLTLATNGSVGECFYQENDFISTSDTTVLIPKNKFNKYIGLYIATLLRKEGKTKYSYGRKWDLEAVKNTVVFLPEKNNKPDWYVIEEYMTKIEERYSFI